VGWANLFFNYHILALKSVGAYKGSQQAVVFSRGLQLFISGIGVALGGGLVILSCSYVISGLIMRIVAKRLFEKEECVREYLFFRKQSVITKEEIFKTFKILWTNTKKAGIMAITDTIMNQSGLFFCTAFIGVYKTAEYGLCSQLAYILCQLGTIYYSTSFSSLANARIKSDVLKQQTIFSTSIVALWAIVFLGIIALSLVVPTLLGIVDSSVSLNVPILVVMGVYLLLQMNCTLYVSFISISNTYPFVWVYVTAAVSQLIIPLVLGIFYRLTIVSILLVSVLSRILLCIGLRWPSSCLDSMNLTAKKFIHIGCNQIYIYARRLFFAKHRTV
jgi:hypothetical protein